MRILSTLSSPEWLSFWEFVEFGSIIIVIIGCWGEGWSAHHKFDDHFASPTPIDPKREKYGRIFWRIVVFGLWAELIAFGFSFTGSNREIEGLKGKNLDLAKNLESLRKVNLELERDLQPRASRLNKERFLMALKEIKPASVDLVYPKDDAETFALLTAMKRPLVSSGWTVLGPRPISEIDALTNDSNAPLIVRAGLAGSAQILIVVKHMNGNANDNTVFDLVGALGNGKGIMGRSAPMAFRTVEDPRLPDNVVKLIFSSQFGGQFYRW
jgi:hypothetical protein